MREFVVPPTPLLTPVQVAERTLVDLLSQTSPEQGTLLTFRGMPGSGVDRVLQKAIEYAREQEWLEYIVSLVPWEKDVPYAALERVCLKMEGLRHLLPLLEADYDPIDIGRRVLHALDIHFEADDRPLLMVFDHLEYCDALSSVVFRYIVMRSTARGANFVLGDSLAYPVDMGDELRQVVYTEPHAHLVVLPEFTAEDIVTHIAQTVGVGIAPSEAERVRRLTGGRYEAIRAYLNSVDEDYLDDLAAIRTLPSVTSARMQGTPEIALENLSEISRLAAQMCALQPDGVSLQKLKLVSNRLDIPFSMDAAVDGVIVVTNLLTGMLHLCDPLSAPDILERTEIDRIRVIHAALADLTFGNESRIHLVLAAVSINDQAVARILEIADDLEKSGHGADALELLDIAIDRAQEEGSSEEGYRTLLLKFGHVFLRQASAVQYQERIADFAKFAEDDNEFALIYLWSRTLKAHGRLEARDVRLDYIAQPAENTDHEFMQAEVARMELLSAAQTGPEALPEAARVAREKFEALLGKTPNNPELSWIDARGRLLCIEAIVLVFELATGIAVTPVESARNIAERAREFPPESPEAVDALTAAGIVLASLGYLQETAGLIAEARDRLDNVQRSTLIGGQLDVLELDVSVRRGDWANARSMVDGALVRAFDGLDMPTRISVPAFKSWLLTVSGHFDEAERYLALAKSSDKYRYPGYGHDMLAVAEAELTQLRHGIPAALGGLEAAAADPRNAASLRVRAMRVEFLVEQGRLEEAIAIWQEIAYIQSLLGGEGATEYMWLGGIVSASRGDVEQAIEAIRQGMAAVRSKFTLGKCHLALATLYMRARGQRDVAEREFEKARTAFAAAGSRPFVDAVVSQSRKAASMTQERLEALTPRERQVATLAARGWRNKEIARELNIGAATVAFHMSNALEKLGIAKRSELASIID